MNKTESYPPVTIVIPHYNGYKILAACLRSLQQTIYPEMEIIVVDNASTDGSAEKIAREFPHVRLIRNSANLGFAGGCNRGIEQATNELICILNNDTTHEPSWLKQLVEVLTGDPDTAAVQPRIRSAHQRNFFDYSGASGGMLDVFGYPFARGRIFNNIEEDREQYDDICEIFWASGTAFLSRKKLLEIAGKFDENFFAHMEEIDLQWKFHLMGFKIMVNPGAIIYHHSGYTLQAESFLKKYLNHRNNLFMLLSNYSLPTLLYIFPLRMLMEVFTLFYALITLDLTRFLAVLKATGWLLLHPHFIFLKRKIVKKIRRIRDLSLMRKMYRGSIVFSYFILQKKKYSQLPPSSLPR